MHHIARSIVLGLFLIAAPPAFALKADVTTFTLDNGLEVVVIPDHRAPVVTHMVWYKVGAADEPKGKSGIAHFLEHLMFKGTDKVQAGEFSKIVRRNGGQDNAFTSNDYTGYFQRIAKDRLPLVMELEADRMANLTLSEEDVATEREVIIEERRSRIDNDPSSRLSEQMSAALYLNHPYGTPVIGWMDEMRGLTLDDALDFYRRYYTPSNAVLVVAGDVTADEVKGFAETYYGRLENTATPGARVRVKEPEPAAERRVVLRDPNAANPSLRRSFLTVATPGAPGEAAALEVLANVLGGGATSLLYRELVVEEKIATNTGAWYSGDNLDYGTFLVYATPAQGVDPAVLEAGIDRVLAMAKEGEFDDTALADAKSALTAEAVYALDSQSRLARIFGAALTTGRTVADVIEWPERIEAVTRDQVVAVANAYLAPERSVLGLLLPVPREAAVGTGSEAPQEPDVVNKDQESEQ